MLMMVDAAVSAAERLQASGDPQWHRVFTETLHRLHQSKPRTYVLATPSGPRQRGAADVSLPLANDVDESLAIQGESTARRRSALSKAGCRD